jgi:hypothetical protein
MPSSSEENQTLKVALTWKDKLVLLVIMFCFLGLNSALGGPNMGVVIVVVVDVVKEMYLAAKEEFLNSKNEEDGNHRNEAQ